MSNEGFYKWICPEHRTYTKRGGHWHTCKTPKCPVCTKDMYNMGTTFQVPKKKDIKAWDELSKNIKRLRTK